MSRVKCSRCGRTFGDMQAFTQHKHMKHGGNAAPVPARKDEPEESVADQMIEAEQNRAMGIPNPDWIEDMLP